MSIRIIFIIGICLIFCTNCSDRKSIDELKYSSQIQLPKHEENWDFYLGLIDSVLASTFVDLGVIYITPVKGFERIVYIKLILKQPNTEKLSSDGELLKLIEIEENLIKLFCEDMLSLYVGRYTTDGYRDHCFYIQDSIEFFQRIPILQEKFPNYEFSYAVSYDPNWEIYTDFLYPSPIQKETIKNRQILRVLEEKGDSLTKRRIVDHWIYFKDESSRFQFLEDAKETNFNIVGIWENSDFSSDYTFGVQINRTDFVSYDEIDNVTHPLSKLAAKYDGFYDGWETFVENKSTANN